MNAEQEIKFLDDLKDVATRSGKPVFQIAQRDEPPNYPTHYMAVALPDGRVGAWAAAYRNADVDDPLNEDVKAKCLEFAHRYPFPQ